VEAAERHSGGIAAGENVHSSKEGQMGYWASEIGPGSSSAYVNWSGL